MKRLLTTTIFSTLFILSVQSQIQWKEYFCHDQLTSNHYGHFIIDGNLTLLMGNTFPPMNTLETIKGNIPSNQDIIREYYSFQTKTTRTGIDSKEILLKQPQDYDIIGNGAYSIYERDDAFLIRHIQGDYYVEPDDALYVTDAYMSGGPFDNKECVTIDKKRVFLTSDDVVLGESDFEGTFVYHEGLDGLSYQILNGTMTSITLPPKGPLELGTYDLLENDPYTYQIVKFEGTTAHRYSYDDFSWVRTDELLDIPLDIQFVDDGFYYLTESDDNYSVVHYSNENSASTLFYELPKIGEIIPFNVDEIVVLGDDIFFMGIWYSNILKRHFSYVQKRTVNEDFIPLRRDLAIDNAKVTRTQIEEPWHRYDYEIEVTNTGNHPISHFTIFTNRLEEDFSQYQFHKQSVEKSIEPGATYTFEGTFNHYFEISKVTFNIMGVDYRFDIDESNNAFTADIVVLSSEDIVGQKFTISPNPCVDFIAIDGPVSEIKCVTLTDIHNRTIQVPFPDFSRIDISQLTPGQYWINVSTKSKTYRETIIKL